MIYIIGTGPMAQEYTKVLLDKQLECIVIGRGETSANKFFEQIGIRPITGGVEKYLTNHSFNEKDQFIIATGTENLMSILLLVLSAGIVNILIEKPAALSIDQLLANESTLKKFEAKIYVAYNRRFYKSTQKALQMIKEDGGLQSIQFEFTEWAHKIEPLVKAEGVKENWFFANSTHVIDLAFFIAGQPNNWQAFVATGQLNWHPKSKFVGAGITQEGVLFSYHSNWESAGRWGIQLCTNKRKIILQPLEELQTQAVGSLAIEYMPLEPTQYKEGMEVQLVRFLTNDDRELCSLEAHIFNTKQVYSKILG